MPSSGGHSRDGSKVVRIHTKATKSNTTPGYRESARLPQGPSKSHFGEATLGKCVHEKTGNSRNCCRVRGGNEGAKGMEADFATTTDRHAETNTQRSQMSITVTDVTCIVTVTCIVPNLGHFRPRLLGVPAQSLTESLDSLHNILSFFLKWRIPNLITRLSGLCTSD